MVKCEICGKETKNRRFCCHPCYAKWLELRPSEAHPLFGTHRNDIWNKGISNEKTKNNGRKSLLTKGRKKNRLCPVCGNYVKRFNKEFCSMECYGKAIKTGMKRSGFQVGYTPFNKGLTSSNSPKLREMYSKRKLSPRCGAGIGGFRKDLGHFVRSTWEANLSRIFILEKTKYVYEPIKICLGDKFYTPDFYLPEKKFYLEVAGYFSQEKRKKLKQILELYPDFPLFILDSEGYKMLEGKYKTLISWEDSTSKKGVGLNGHAVK